MVTVTTCKSDEVSWYYMRVSDTFKSAAHACGTRALGGVLIEERKEKQVSGWRGEVM